MAIFRCNKCGHIREVPNDYIGKSVNCPRCKQVNPIHDTVGFVGKIIEKYLAQYKELKQLREQLPLANLAELTDLTTGDEQQALTDIDIYNTTALASQQQYEPIVAWFKQHKIQLDINQQAIDTTGFFDEVAMQLGDNYGILSLVSDQIRYVQQKGYTNVKLTLGKRSQKEVKKLLDSARNCMITRLLLNIFITSKIRLFASHFKPLRKSYGFSMGNGWSGLCL